MIMTIEEETTGDAQCNLSPFADQCQTPEPRSAMLPGNSPSLYTGHDSLWNGISL